MFPYRRVIAVMSAVVLILLMAVPASAGSKGGEEDICISRGGVTIRQAGSAFCDSDRTSTASARGFESEAYAFGNSRADANGDFADARAEERSRATATGYNADADAYDSSTAVAQGENADAEAYERCRVTARAGQFRSCGDD